MSLIELKNVHKTYGDGRSSLWHKPGALAVHALRGVDLMIGKGEMVAIMGKSGSGKSTLLNILGALDRMSEGEYLFDGTKVRIDNPSRAAAFRREQVGFIERPVVWVEKDHSKFAEFGRHGTKFLKGRASRIRRSPLPERLVKQYGGRRRNIETVGRAAHRESNGGNVGASPCLC